jgi:hypothetical protein
LGFKFTLYIYLNLIKLALLNNQLRFSINAVPVINQFTIKKFKMMKIKSLLLLATIAFSTTSYGQWKNNQAWDYSFGTTKAVFENKKEISTNSVSDAKKAGFLPLPNAAITSVMIGPKGTGTFTLNGDETLTAKMGDVGMTRFAINNPNTATQVLKFSCVLKFSETATGKGNYTLALGNDQGKLFSPKHLGGVWRSNSEVFTSLAWNFPANSEQINFIYREGSDASKTTTQKPINKTLFVKGAENKLELYCNNSETTQKYKVGNTEYELPSATFHVWVNNKKIGADFPKSIEVDGDQGLAAGTSVALAIGKPLNSILISTNNGSEESQSDVTISKVSMVYATK